VRSPVGAIAGLGHGCERDLACHRGAAGVIPVLHTIGSWLVSCTDAGDPSHSERPRESALSSATAKDEMPMS